MEIKDCLHLYLGCLGLGGSGCAVVLNGNAYDLIMRDEMTFKPILRPLTDMTIGEFRGAAEITTPKDKLEEATNEQFQAAHNEIIIGTFDGLDFEGVPSKIVFELTRYFLSKHFDLFGLIDAGLAIDATTVNAIK
jgi:hypothetical protein